MYIDSHTHLDFFNENIDKAIEDINKNKILTIANSMDIKSYIKNKEYSKRSKYIIPVFGIHPWKAHEFNGQLKDLIPYIEESKLIGEIGLDFFWVEDTSTYKKQREVFNFILSESIKRNKVVTIHTKGAEEKICEELSKSNYDKVLIHWYSGSLETLEKLINLGCYFTISVDIGYSDLVTKILNLIPLDKLLVETDGPTALEWVNGEKAYPSYIKEVVKKIGEIKMINEDELRRIINNNYCNLIGN